jgi:hypothetical protein
MHTTATCTAGEFVGINTLRHAIENDWQDIALKLVEVMHLSIYQSIIYLYLCMYIYIYIYILSLSLTLSLSLSLSIYIYIYNICTHNR